MAIPSSSNRGVLGRIGATQGAGAATSVVGQSTGPAFVTASGIPPLGWLGIFNTGRYLTFLDSGTFTAPVSGYYRVRVLGAGGSGATISGTMKRATGGGGGGYSMGTIWLTQGQSIPVTVGKGGVWSGDGQPGSVGGTSTFGAYISATGGAGGLCADAAKAVAGALGGVGTGGSLINANGGKSGSIDANAGYSASGGGGAGSQLGHGGDSGSISGGASNNNAATGGGGVGGATSASIIRGSEQATGGAGVASASTALLGGFDLLSVGANLNINGTVNSSSAAFRFPGDGFAGGGGPNYHTTSNGGIGGTGAGGGATIASNGTCTSGAGGVFGGAGAAASANATIAPKPGFGGGGGGAACNGGGQSTGGDGLIVVEW